ncbi:MAG: formate dehydrogenase accessory sulfurtransferase FdhD, partial [Acidimicrobiia bacterium]
MTSVKRTVITVVGGSGDRRDDLLAEEAPIELRLGGVPLAVLMRTPGADVDLARGFALTEGIVLGPGEIVDVEQVDEGDRYELVLAGGVEVDPSRFQRSTFVS